jgi:hypothetical protein
MGLAACLFMFIAASLLLIVAAGCLLLLLNRKPQQRITVTRTTDYQIVGFPPVSALEMAYLAQQQAEDSVPRYYLPPHLVSCPEDYNYAATSVAQEQFANVVVGRRHGQRRLH